MSDKQKESSKEKKDLTYAESDRMQLRKFGEDFLRDINYHKWRLESRSDIDKNSLTVSLNAPFGHGKTTFKDIWKNENLKEYQFLDINAWESDFDKDPLPVILFYLSEYLEAKNKTGIVKLIKKNIVPLAKKEGFKIADLLILLKSNLYVDTKKVTKQIQKFIENYSEELFTDFKKRKKALKDTKDSIERYLSGLDKPLFILVDELDRCRPEYAIKFLETVKHFFDIKGLVFVFFINQDLLNSHIKQIHGDKFDLLGYFNKFFHMQEELPSIYSKLRFYLNQKLQITKLHEYSDFDIASQLEGQDTVDCIIHLIDYFQFSLRDIQFLVESLNPSALSESKNSQTGIGKVTSMFSDEEYLARAFFIALNIKARTCERSKELFDIFVYEFDKLTQSQNAFDIHSYRMSLNRLEFLSKYESINEKKISSNQKQIAESILSMFASRLKAKERP